VRPVPIHAKENVVGDVELDTWIGGGRLRVRTGSARRRGAIACTASRTVSGIHREETSMPDAAASATRLVAVEDLDERQVTVVETPHGPLAVGISGGEPFAVSNRCRHLFASLGEGRVASDGCLECPRHAARYDVRTGAMSRGPQGAFKPLAGVVKNTTGARALKTFPVTLRDGAICLEG
jgi:3-phenylpropionate/trans-cinnamate dioxygenase ferredoxin subunit